MKAETKAALGTATTLAVLTGVGAIVGRRSGETMMGALVGATIGAAATSSYYAVRTGDTPPSGGVAGVFVGESFT